jgi:hypothetical protein
MTPIEIGGGRPRSRELVEGDVTAAGVPGFASSPFTVAHPSTGHYKITLTNKLPSPREMMVTASGIVPAVAVPVVTSGANAEVFEIVWYNVSGGTFVDMPFSFKV